MRKKHYEKPSIEELALSETGMLMTSGNAVMRADYGNAVEETWED